MEKVKKILNKIFIDGLSGMALGLFATLIVGTIIQQSQRLSLVLSGSTLFLIGKVAASLTGAGIGCGVAYKFKEAPLVVLSSATCGMVGAFAGKLMAGTVFTDGAIHYAGPGRAFGRFYCRLCRDCNRTFGQWENEGGHPAYPPLLHLCRFRSGFAVGAAHFRLYGMDWGYG